MEFSLYSMQAAINKLCGIFGEHTRAKNERSVRKSYARTERYKNERYLKAMKRRLIQRKKDWMVRVSKAADERRKPTNLDRGYALAISVSDDPVLAARLGVRLVEEGSKEAQELYTLLEKQGK